MRKKKSVGHPESRSGLRVYHRIILRLKKDLRERDNRKKLVMNMAICVVLAVVLHVWLLGTDWGEEKLNKIIDFLFIEREAGTAMEKVRSDLRYVFVEVDDESYREWGSPLITPRAVIAKAVETAYRGGAKVIFMDFLLETPDSSAEGDLALRQVLETIRAEQGDTNVVFPIRLRGDGTPRETIYDDLIDQSPVLHRAIPKGVASSQKENIVRYWREYQTYQTPEGTQILWGAPLLIAALAEGKYGELEQIGEKLVSGSDDYYTLGLTKQNRVRIGRSQADPLRNRIRFSIFHPSINRVGNLDAKTRVNINEIGYYASDSRFFKDKIVFIGNTSSDQGDLHLTPVGVMPGVYLIANATETLLGAQQLRTSVWWGTLFWDGVIICVASVAYLYGFEVLVTLILGCIFYGLGYLVFHYCNVFPSSIMLIAAIGLFKIVDGVREAYAGVRKMVQLGAQLRRKG